MSTPYNAPYKVEQREAKASKHRVYPRWVSCHVFYDGLTITKIPAQGTYRCRIGRRGKAAVRAAKRAVRAMQKYMDKQVSMTASLIAEVDPDLVVTKRIYGAAQ